MGKVRRAVYVPDEERAAAYDALFAEYTTLHDHFGRPAANDVMHRLRRIRREALPMTVTDPRPRQRGRGPAAAARRWPGCTRELVRYGLVVWTAGNVSGRVPGADLLVIKPSGVVLRRADPGQHGRLRPRRRGGGGRLLAVQRHRRARLRLPAHARRRRRRAHPLDLRLRLGRPGRGRSRACSRRWPTSSAARSRSARSRSSATTPSARASSRPCRGTAPPRS